MHRIESSNYIRDSLGRNLFIDGPPGTTVNDAWLNAIQEEICNVIEWAGLNVLNKYSDTRDQLRTAFMRLSSSFDVIITGQPAFNNIIERVAANQYQIKSSYKSVYFKNISGGFKMTGASAPLSGGDTWGYLQTNQCTLLYGEPGSSIDMGDDVGYLEVNTDNCRLQNIHITGTNIIDSAVTTSFLLNAKYVEFDKCSVSNRYTNVQMDCFTGGTLLQNMTSRYNNCSVSNIRTSSGADTIVAFGGCWNINNCSIYNITSNSYKDIFMACQNINNCTVYNIASTNLDVVIFNTCHNINNCIINSISVTTGSLSIFWLCEKISNCFIYTLDATTGTIKLFDLCTAISLCSSYDVDTTSADIYGLLSCNCVSSCYLYDFQAGGNNSIYGAAACNNLSSCYFKQFDLTGNASMYGFYQSYQISACKIEDFDNANGASSNGHIFGYYQCNQVSSSIVYDIQSNSQNANVHAFYTCLQISACNATQIDSSGAGGSAYGFNICRQISACYADDIDATVTSEGFHGCEYGSSLYSTEAANAANDWFDSVDAQITNKVSTPSIWT